MNAVRVGAVGDFARESFGELLAPRVLEVELRRRLGDIEFRWFSEAPEPLPMDGGFTAEPLPVPEDQLDLVFHWDGPELGFLVDRVFSPKLLAQRVADLRLLGRLPPRGDGLVAVQGGTALLDRIDEICAAIAATGLEPVLVEAEPCEGDARFADALASRLDAPRVPASGVEDVVAVIGEVQLLLASSHAALATASALGVPSRKLGTHDVTGSAQQVDHRLDDIAAAAPPRKGAASRPLDAMRTAHGARGRQMLEERLRWLDRHECLERELATLRSERDNARAHAHWLQSQLEAIWGSRSWRLLTPVHNLVRAMRKGQR